MYGADDIFSDFCLGLIVKVAHNDVFCVYSVKRCTEEIFFKNIIISSVVGIRPPAGPHRKMVFAPVSAHLAPEGKSDVTTYFYGTFLSQAPSLPCLPTVALII